MFARMRQGWELTKKAWSVVRQNPRLAKLPLTGGVIAVVVGLLFAAPGVWLAASDSDAAVLVGYLMIAVGSYLASFVVIYYNVILAGAANDVLAGREPDVAAARQVAQHRIPTIAGWALVSAVVSVALSALRDRGGVAGQIAASLGAAIWGLVTFLVIPVVALEDVGPITAIKRSGSLVRTRWGQQVTGNLVIGGFSGLVTLLGVAGVIGGVFLISSGGALVALGGLLVLVGIGLAVASAVFAGATRGVFGVALYHFAAESRAVGPFTEGELAASATAR